VGSGGNLNTVVSSKWVWLPEGLLGGSREELLPRRTFTQEYCCRTVVSMILSDASIARPEQTQSEDQNEPKYVDVAMVATCGIWTCVEGWCLDILPYGVGTYPSLAVYLALPSISRH
jgi:hypothetical protein